LLNKRSATDSTIGWCLSNSLVCYSTCMAGLARTVLVSPEKDVGDDILSCERDGIDGTRALALLGGRVLTISTQSIIQVHYLPICIPLYVYFSHFVQPKRDLSKKSRTCHRCLYFFRGSRYKKGVCVALRS
jgi:hypothetical protein